MKPTFNLTIQVLLEILAKKALVGGAGIKFNLMVVVVGGGGGGFKLPPPPPPKLL